MKRLILVCFLAVSSHGWAADLDPECYELYDQFLAADWVNAGRVAGRMHDMQCWPALQGIEGSSSDQQVLPTATDCNSLVPHVVKMINDQAHVNGYSIVQTADAKVMTYETIDRVADGHDIFITITDNQGRSARGRQGLKHDDTAYVRGKGYYTSPKYAYNDEGYYVPISPAYTYGNDGTVLVPNSKPFAAIPLTGSTRALDCSAEAQFTQGSYLIQMYLDRNDNGQEFIGMSVLMEL